MDLCSEIFCHIFNPCSERLKNKFSWPSGCSRSVAFKGLIEVIVELNDAVNRSQI